MKSMRKTYRAASLLLCGSLLAGGCTGNAAADGGIMGAAAGGLTYLGLKAAGVKDKAAAGIALGVGAAAGVVTFISSNAKYKREADEAEKEKARREAERVAEQDRVANRERTDDYYVPVSKTEDGVALQKIDHETNEPTGEVLVYDEQDLRDAQAEGQTVKIDGHELAGKI